jgi:uncharacterized membrane protein YeaQ/YmgE (transglycosylase-associated protein family)
MIERFCVGLESDVAYTQLRSDVGMEETEAFREPADESLQKHHNGRLSDAEALRTVILVVGFILFIPALVSLILGVASVLTRPDYGPEDYRTYLWMTQIIGIVSVVGAMAAGYLLLRIARKRPVYSVGEMFYPAVAIIGAYLVLLATVQVVNPIIFHYCFIGDFSLYAASSAAFSGLYLLPQFVGGALLIMIGKHQYPIRR